MRHIHLLQDHEKHPASLFSLNGAFLQKPDPTGESAMKTGVTIAEIAKFIKIIPDKKTSAERMA